MKQLVCITIGVVCGSLFGWFVLGPAISPTPTAPVVHQDGLMGDDGHQRVPTMRDVQQGLLDAGCDIGDDGVDGKIGPNTLKAWEVYDCNTMALRIDGHYYKETK